MFLIFDILVFAMQYCEIVNFLLSMSGVVDVPYLVLEPTHNKQNFADGKVSEAKDSFYEKQKTLEYSCKVVAH